MPDPPSCYAMTNDCQPLNAAMAAARYIAICELGSLQSLWPVEPPSARTCMV